MLDVAIVLSGEIADREGFDYLVRSAAYLVAVDGGLNHLVDLDIIPDLFLGDFDSVGKDALAKAEQWQIDIIKFPVHKNYSDSELAVKEILFGQRFDLIAAKPVIGLLAAFGSRYDHLLNNQLLAKRFIEHADFILSDGLLLQWILAGPRKFSLNWPCTEANLAKEYIFSVLALSKSVKNLTICNSEYILNKYDLHSGHSIGISNLAQNADYKRTSEVEISFDKGCLTVIILPED
ncbi:MAG TPA: thiamine diphosphokinase [Clostridiaceae bacterium]|nr:thiamine diphosphokinase [Clostridiaceae bacterium]